MDNLQLENKAHNPAPAITARKIVLSGKVQGVGFRPFIYQLAHQYDLTGWVRNCVGTVQIHIQGQQHNIDNFLTDIFKHKPVASQPVIESDQQNTCAQYTSFDILESSDQGKAHISVPADLDLCENCLQELNNPADRRYLYPFINCTQCGPRYTLIRHLPYDRVNTTMADFILCTACQAEYNNPDNRRFHAEPVACADCGPTLFFKQKPADSPVISNSDSLNFAIEILRAGKILAVKGIGGYHLMCDANNTQAVNRLRDKKSRPDKPLAVMFPAPAAHPFQFAELEINLSNQDRAFLLQASRPVLLVNKKSNSALSEQLAPGLNQLGVMLPYSPLHHLLLNQFAGALVATSANISGEPVLTDQQEVEKRLKHIADAYLYHNRKIERPADDPVYKTIYKKPRPVRLGRGVSPLELNLSVKLKKPVLAVGAHMKNTITLAWDNRAVISPHIGEMNSPRCLQIFEKTITDLQQLYGVRAEEIICDAHPAYTTTRWAKKQTLPVHYVYHHHAHASAAYYECDTQDNIMVFTWDGTGYGEDGSIWGGETFIGKPGVWTRFASMRPFYLPGGEKAGREPWRSAAAVCWETEEPYAINEENNEKFSLLHQAWMQKINSPRTSSVGRLFDAAAAITGVCKQASFEGQAPMLLEAACNSSNIDTNNSEFIPLTLDKKNNLYETDWQPLLKVILDTSINSRKRACIFHNTLANLILQQAILIRQQHNINTVSFSGGVFQNQILTETACELLNKHHFKVCLAEKIPLNDAGISPGQVIQYTYKNNSHR